jgi:hypothetical protein
MMSAKGRREQTKGGDEADAASRRARRIVTFWPGELRKIKRRMNKRTRQLAKVETRLES